MAAEKFNPYGPEFQALRLEALERDKRRCCACNHDGSQYRLEIHHRRYRDPPLLEDLYTFCVECHDIWTDAQRRKRYARRSTISVEDTPPESGRPNGIVREIPPMLEEVPQEIGRPNGIVRERPPMLDYEVPETGRPMASRNEQVPEEKSETTTEVELWMLITITM